MLRSRLAGTGGKDNDRLSWLCVQGKDSRQGGEREGRTRETKWCREEVVRSLIASKLGQFDHCPKVYVGKMMIR